MKLVRAIFFIYYCIFFVAEITPAFAQQNMESLLNNIDTPASWANTPLSAPSTASPLQYSSNLVNQSSTLLQSNGTQSMKQQLLRTLLKGTSPSSNSSGNNKADWGSSNAYSDWQEAENQASRAHDAEERARYDKDKWRRGDDASEAYYAANSAQNASDKVYYASLNGDPTAKQYADKAKAAADRAREESNRARYYADSNN